MFKWDEIVCGVDIGSNSIKAAQVSLHPDEEHFEFHGLVKNNSRGIRQGNIVDIEQAIIMLRDTLQELEQVSGRKINRCILNINGTHLKCFNCQGRIAISRDDYDRDEREISPEDVWRARDHALNLKLPEGQEIVQALPQQYLIDSTNEVKNPVGLTGEFLEAYLHVVTGLSSRISDLRKCVRSAGYQVSGFIYNSLAAAESVLTPDEKKLGVIVVDLGAGTTNYLIYQGGIVRDSGVIPLGAELITSDISILLRIPIEEAERLKLLYGNCFPTAIEKDKSFTVQDVGNGQRHEIKVGVLAQYIEARAAEIFDFLLNEVRKSEFFHYISAGVVLTGGGARLKGIMQLAEEKFQMPVRTGFVTLIPGLPVEYKEPEFATVLGLSCYALKHQEDQIRDNGKLNKIWERTKERLTRIFEFL